LGCLLNRAKRGIYNIKYFAKDAKDKGMSPFEMVTEWFDKDFELLEASDDVLHLGPPENYPETFRDTKLKNFNNSITYELVPIIVIESRVARCYKVPLVYTVDMSGESDGGRKDDCTSEKSVCDNSLPVVEKCHQARGMKKSYVVTRPLIRPVDAQNVTVNCSHHEEVTISSFTLLSYTLMRF
jgi:hypothetical protein